MPELNEKHRIQYKDKLYEINSVIDVDTGHYKMIIDCSEVKDGV
jgi:SPP1 family predicted phage head-tail adaptor